MNMKFILFCVAGIGTLMLLYMWFTMNKTITNSQLVEEQYLYRISSLKSEIDFEKRLIDNLRKDIKINNQNYQQKKVLLESMKRKEIDNESERNKLEKEIESLKVEHDKTLTTFEEEKRKIKAENNAKLLLDKQEIEKLTNELKKLEETRNELLAKHKTTPNKTLNQLETDTKPIHENRQGKPPSISRNKKKLNEKEKESNQQSQDEPTVIKGKSIPKEGLNSNKPKEGLQIENDDFQIAHKIKPYDAADDNAESLDKLKQDGVKIESVSQSLSVKKNKEKGNESQQDSPRQDVKTKETNNEQYNPKILAKHQKQLNPPKRRNKEDKKPVINNDSLFARPKMDDEGNIQENRQLKPPKKEENSKDNVVNPPFLDNNNMKNRMKNDPQMEPDK